MTKTTIATAEIKTTLQLFTEGATDIVEKIRSEVSKFIPDISTEKGRKEIASVAHKVARAKNEVDRLGKESVADMKAMTKKVDAERGRIWDEMEAMQAEVRKPLTEWEERDIKRVAEHDRIVKEMREMFIFTTEPSIPDIERRIARLKEYAERDFEEFTHLAHPARENAISLLTIRKEGILKQAAEQEELSRLRAESDERKRKEEERAREEREELAKQEAADRARKEAEEKAAREAKEREEKHKAEQEAAAKREEDVKRQKQEADEAARVAHEARKAAEEKAVKDAADAEQRRLNDLAIAERRAKDDAAAAEEKHQRELKEAGERARREADIERQKAVERAEQDRKAASEEEAKRAANKKHRTKINNDALSVLCNLTGEDKDEPETSARKIIEAIAKGHVPHISIAY